MIVWPGLRRSVSAISRLFNSASFVAPLTHSATPVRAASGTTATFTRATTATVRDNEGVLRTVPAGCARFEGARMVRNLCQTSSEVMTSANGWTASNCVQVKNLTGPDGVANSAYTVTASAGNALFYNGAATIIAPSTAACFSVYLKRVTGTGTIQISADGANTLTTVTLTSDWTRFSVVKTGTGSFGVIKIVTNGDAIGVARWQLEDITGRTDQTTPSEYVSVGVLSAPYHGAGIDGVKYFDTDLSGNPIAASINTGYVAEGARTNLCLQSNAFTTTWTQNGTPAPTQNVVGPDGATSAWTLTDNDVGVQEGIEQTITLTAAAYTFSIYIKKTVGAQSSYPVIYAYNGATLIAPVTVDTSNGIATAWTSYNAGGIPIASGFTASCTAANANFWFVQFTFTGTAVGWVFRFYPAATTNATQSTGLPSATVTGSAVIYGAQVELGSFASSYIPTTTIAVARNADVLTYSSAGNVSGTVGTVYCEASVADFSNTRRVFDLNTGGTSVPIYYQLSNGFQSFHDGTAARSAGVVGTAGVVTKLGLAYGGAEGLMSKNGTNQTAQTFDGSFGTITDFSPGGGYAAGQEIFGNIRNVRIWQRALSSSELQAVTA